MKLTIKRKLKNRIVSCIEKIKNDKITNLVPFIRTFDFKNKESFSILIQESERYQDYIQVYVKFKNFTDFINIEEISNLNILRFICIDIVNHLNHIVLLKEVERRNNEFKEFISKIMNEISEEELAS